MSGIDEVTTGLTRVDDTLWVSRANRAVSYPDEGHDSCFAVEEGSFWFRHRNRVIVSLVAAHAPGETIFDVGGGNGYVSLGLSRAGIRSVVLEPGAAGIEHARARGLRPLVHSTFEDAGFRPGSVGAFGLFDILEHIEDDLAFLRSMRACLRPNGVLFLTVPAFRCLWSAEDDEARHHRRYTAASLRRTLQAADLVVRYCSYFFWPLAPAILLARTLPSRLGLRRRASQRTTEREHAPLGGAMGRLVERALDWEAGRIQAGRRLPAGSSCIAVATRT